MLKNWLSGAAAPAARGKTEPGSLSVFTCDNDQDNIPVISVVGQPPDESLFCISQSRIPGYKPNGQDCMSTGSKGDWICSVLCDGHDRDGLIVAQAICSTLPKLVLKRVYSSGSNGDQVPEKVLIDSFLECERRVCWTSEGICEGMFVRVTGGEWNGSVGYVKEVSESGAFRLVIVDEQGYHKPLVEKKHLNGAKFAGGCTCVCFLRHKVTNKCRIAFVGDSRAMLMYPQQDFDSVFFPCTEQVDDAGFPIAVATSAHNLVNESELARLQQGNPKDYEIDGDFLVNPVTGFAIQPTRGFGDFDMYGTGYTSEPEVSGEFVMKPGMLILVASDGVFDSHVWQDAEIVDFFERHSEYETDLEELADGLYDDTLVRSQDGGYVDDISFFLFSPADGPPAEVGLSPEQLERQRVQAARRQEREEADRLRAVAKREQEAQVQEALRKAEEAKDLERRLRTESFEANARAEAQRIRAEVEAKVAEERRLSQQGSGRLSRSGSGRSQGKKSKKKGSGRLSGADMGAVPELEAAPATSLRRGSSRGPFSFRGEEPEKESLLKKLMGRTPKQKYKHMQKSKSMSALSFRKGRVAEFAPPRAIRQREHVPSTGRLSDDGRRRGKSLELSPTYSEALVQQRDSVRRGPGSFTDLAQFSPETGNFSSQRQLSVGEAHLQQKAPPKPSAAQRKSKIEHFQERAKQKAEQDKLRIQLMESQGGLTLSDEGDGLVKELLSRIAVKYGHDIAELEEIAKEVKHTSMMRRS